MSIYYKIRMFGRQRTLPLKEHYPYWKSEIHQFNCQNQLRLYNKHRISNHYEAFILLNHIDTHIFN